MDVLLGVSLGEDGLHLPKSVLEKAKGGVPCTWLKGLWRLECVATEVGQEAQGCVQIPHQDECSCGKAGAGRNGDT